MSSTKVRSSEAFIFEEDPNRKFMFGDLAGVRVKILGGRDETLLRIAVSRVLKPYDFYSRSLDAKVSNAVFKIWNDANSLGTALTDEDNADSGNDKERQKFLHDMFLPAILRRNHF